MKNISILLLAISLLTFCCVNKSSTKNKSDSDIIKTIDDASLNNFKTKKLCTGLYYVIDTVNDFKYPLDKSSEIYYLDPNPIVIKDNIKSTEIYETSFQGQYPDYVGLKILLDDFGTKKWADATQKARGNKLAFILDNKLINIALVNSQITNGMAAINRTEYNKKEIEAFKSKLD